MRRRPYSVVLLDEIEKAHPDVHEIFFQVFDKGVMEDGTGRRIDFRNTLILLTSNVGTDDDHGRGRATDAPPDAEALAAALRPALLEVFPPALLGRVVTIPYYPLSADMLAGIVRLQLDRIGKRIAENHRGEIRSTIERGRSHRLALQRPGFRRPRDRQHHHQHDPAGAVARDPQALAGARGDPRGQGLCGGRRIRL